MPLLSKYHPIIIKYNKDIINTSKPNYLFRLINQLLYNYNNNSRKYLIIPISLIIKILYNAYNNYYYLRYNRIIITLNNIYIRFKK